MGKAIIISGVSFALNNFGKVTPHIEVPVVSIAILGDSTVEKTAQFSIEYNPSNTTQLGVTWEITSGSSYASIDSVTGVISVVPGTVNETVEIKATSLYNSSVYATKTLLVSHTLEYGILEQITLRLDASYPSIMRKTSGANYLESMLYSTAGTKKLNTITIESTAQGFITDDMYFIDIPSGATGVRVSGQGLYFNSRNVRITTLPADLATSGKVENTISSSPSDVTFGANAAFLYVRISVAAVGDTYVKPYLTWLYE